MQQRRRLGPPRCRHSARARPRFGSSAKFRRTLEAWLIRVVLWIIIALTLVPVVYVVLYSLKGGGSSLFSSTLIPEKLTFDNYQQILEGDFPALGRQ